MIKLKLLAAATLAIASTVASASATYVGSWQVDNGPEWNSSSVAYSGQDAAALLFGGSASDYVISTVDSNAADINGKTWVSTWGGACGGAFPCGTQVADTFSQNTGGLYLTPGDTSAYVTDWAVGSQYTNYAFKISAVPEPTNVVLMLAAVAALGTQLRRRNQAR
jgi:hypothetical protein